MTHTAPGNFTYITSIELSKSLQAKYDTLYFMPEENEGRNFV